MIQAEGWYAEGKSFRKKIREMGLGYVTRYIQSAGGYCYYYKDGKSSGRGGPNMWRYDAKSAVPSSHTTTSCSKKSNAARRSNTYLDESGAKCIPSKMMYCGNIRDATTAQRCFDRCLANNTCR